MRRSIILFVALLATTATVQSQGLNDNYFGMFKDVHNPEINCNTGLRDNMAIQQCMRRDMMKASSDLTNYTYVGKPTQVNTNKVAAGIRAARPKSGHVKGSVGSYNYNTSDAHIQWQRNRQAQIQAQREEAARKKKIEDMQRRIADNNRAAAVTASTNAMLQGQTNARMQRDQWHATEGARLTQTRARQAVRVTGPQFDNLKPQSSSQKQASRLRGANKPRRVMVNNVRRNNAVRRQLAKVRHMEANAERVKAYREACQREIHRRREAQQAMANKKKYSGAYKGFTLDPHAVPVTAQPTTLPGPNPFTTPEIPPRKTTPSGLNPTSDYYDELLPS